MITNLKTINQGRNIKNELKYTLIKARSKNNYNDDSSMYSGSDYNKEELMKTQEKFKNIHTRYK